MSPDGDNGRASTGKAPGFTLTRPLLQGPHIHRPPLPAALRPPPHTLCEPHIALCTAVALEIFATLWKRIKGQM